MDSKQLLFERMHSVGGMPKYMNDSSIVDQLINRITFFKEYNVHGKSVNKLQAQKIEYYKNVKVPSTDGEIYTFKQYNPVSNFSFQYYGDQDKTYLFSLKNEIVLIPPGNDIVQRAIILAQKQVNEKLSYSKEIRNEGITKQEFDQIINDINGVLFKFEEHTEKSNAPIFK